MTSLADAVACLVLETYNSLPKVGKPSVRTNGLAEWTMIAGLVVKREGTQSKSQFFLNLRFNIALSELGNGCKMFCQIAKWLKPTDLLYMTHMLKFLLFEAQVCLSTL